MQRQAGLVVPLFSLRGGRGWGVGEIPDLAAFARWAAGAGFGTVQVLPVNEVCPGLTSPYSASSAFALDPAYLAIDRLQDFEEAGGRGALTQADRDAIERLEREPLVRWDEVRSVKARGARLAFRSFLDKHARGNGDRARALRDYVESNPWVGDYALFSALHEREQRAWTDWPEPLRDRAPDALEATRGELADALLERQWLQWQLDLQWREVRAALRELGVTLMGDLPFVVAHDSADVWSHRDQFWLDASLGVPPTTPQEAPQDWGLPVYDWARMKQDGFGWMKLRAARVAELYDSYRVDHVIGLYRSYYTRGEERGFSPTEEPEQRAQGEALLALLRERAEIVAEDLGVVPPFIRESLDNLQVPGYRVLRWEKDDGVHRDPATWPACAVATAGTHDTNSAAEWYDALSPDERSAVAKIPGLEVAATHETYDLEVKDALLHVLYRSPCDLLLLSIEDALGRKGQINVPGTVTADNWSLRMAEPIDALAADDGQRSYLAGLARESGRAA